ncbi:MAG: hypothetical protein ACXU86_06080, partial [Archangium sp.]
MQASASSSSLPYEAGPIARRMFLTQQLYTLFGTPPLVYLMTLITGLDRQQTLDVSKSLLPPMVLVLGIAVPYLSIHLSVRRALATVPGEPPGARLARILEVPGLLDLSTLLTTLAASGLFVGLSAFRHGKNIWTIPWAMGTIWLLVALLTLQQRIAYEKILAPYALAEFHQNPGQMPRRYGFLWPRQSWYLPYAFGLFVACTLASIASILGRQAYDAHTFLMGRLDGAGLAETKVVVRETFRMLFEDSVVPLSLVGA